VTLNGRQAKQLSDALLDAFPTRGDLEQMVFLGMNTNLERIVGGGPLTHQLRELVVWAQAQGRLEELVATAHQTNPSNPTLTQLSVDFDSWKSAPLVPGPAPSTPEVNQAALRTAMVGAFSSDELQTLCADVEQILKDSGHELTVNLETVGGSSKPVQVLNLIQYLQRRGRLPALLQAVRAARPGLI
jgi:hypothetical protein